MTLESDPIAWLSDPDETLLAHGSHDYLPFPPTFPYSAAIYRPRLASADYVNCWVTMNNAWWSNEKIDATVNRNYIISRLPQKERHNLYRPLSFGDGLTDDNYLDWILQRGRRLFLILEEIGIPEWIFDAIDQSFDDDDLPISENDLGEFHLSRNKSDALEKKFYRRQFNYLIQELGKGHVDYAENAIVPLENVAKRPGVLAIQSSDKVYRTEKPEVIYTRKRVLIGGDNGVDKIHFVMHLKALSLLKHRHLVSVWATYTQGDHGFILLTPSAEITLKAFLDDQPRSFKQISKQERREMMFGWIHCLTSALAYLHENGYTHQAIRPSNILLDSTYTIFLGEFSAYQCLDDKLSNYRSEIYEYDSPEKWQRTATLQETAPLRSTLHGGGRTGRKLPTPNPNPKPPSTPLSPPPTNKAAQIFEATQLFNYRRASTPVSTQQLAPTIRSSTTHSSSSSTKSTKGVKALITTFATTPSSFPSDIYSLACIHLLLLSALLSHTPKSFAHARSKANRSAGRGGAPADASFHANSEAVAGWMARLEREACAKIRDEGVGCFEAVGGVLQVVRQGMLRREVGERWAARVCAGRLGGVVGRWVVGPGVCGCADAGAANGGGEEREEAGSADGGSVRVGPGPESAGASRRGSDATTGFTGLMGLGVGVGQARKASVGSQRSVATTADSLADCRAESIPERVGSGTSWFSDPADEVRGAGLVQSVSAPSLGESGAVAVAVGFPGAGGGGGAGGKGKGFGKGKGGRMGLGFGKGLGLGLGFGKGKGNRRNEEWPLRNKDVLSGILKG